MRVTVRDTGPGLPEEETERVFERFYRGARSRTRAERQGSDGGTTPSGTRQTGAGLGLTVARGLVQAHGGRMWVESRPGSGAAFHFTPPAA